MNGPFSLGFYVLGLILIVGGTIWLLILFQPEEDSTRTADDERLINVGFGQYNTEGLVAFRAIAAIVVGIIFVILGILL